MKNVTKCIGTNCPLKLSCTRYLGRTLETQSYFVNVPYNKEKEACEYFMQVEPRILTIPSLPSKKVAWRDKDVVMLHACFTLLEQFIDEEKGDEHNCYKTYKKEIDELRFLYKWWQERKVKEYNGTKEEMDEDTKMLSRLMKIRLFLWT